MAAAQGNITARLGGPRIMLLLVTFAIILLGLVMVYSASVGEAVANDSTDSSYYLIKQAICVGVGAALGGILWKFMPPHRWRGFWTWAALIFTVVLLVATWLYGVATNGAQRWIYIGSSSLQPSDFAKIAIIIVGARIYADFREGLLDLKSAGILALVTVILPVGFLYVTQSDLGTTIIILVGLLAVLWFGECPTKIIFAIIGLAIVAVLISIVGTSYRSDRMYFLDPWNDGQNGSGLGFQLIRSFYAFAQGGIFGAGIGNSTEKLTPLPEAETDFIYAIIGEELGLIGTVAVVVLFLLLLVAGLLIASQAEDDFAKMMAGSLTVMLVFQAFLNMGCVTGLLPTTGKPLPFISSGGSSMVASLMMVGLILTAAPTGSHAHTSVHDKRRDNLRIVRSVDARASQTGGTRVPQAGGARAYRGARNETAATSRLSLAMPLRSSRQMTLAGSGARGASTSGRRERR